jgi:hypothetical protein
MANPERNYQEGDVFQVVKGEQYGGMLVYLHQNRGWGIIAMLPVKQPGLDVGFAVLRLTWEEIEYVGSPTMVPEFG